MADEWTQLLDRFRVLLVNLEEKPFDGNAMWRHHCLENALDLLEENPDAASKHLDDYDRQPSTRDISDMFTKPPNYPSVEDMRRRFDNLGGGIV